VTWDNGRNYKVLHVWDTRVNSGTNLDDSLENSPITQRIVSRVSVRQGGDSTLQQSSMYDLEKIQSPFPKNISLRFISHQKFKRQVMDEIRSFHPDLIVFHFGQCAARFMRKLKKMDIPFVVAFYGHDLSVALKSKRWRFRYKIFTETNGGFLVLANDPRSRLISLGIPENQILMYSFPLEIAPYLEIENKSSSKTFRITIPGRFVEKKGHKYLFEAIHLLKNSQIHIHLTVLGYGERQNYFQEIQSLGIQDQITWVDTSEATINGEFNQVYAETLSQTDLVVLPCTTSIDGDNEAGPALVLCLAQAAGVPVITTAFEGHEVSIIPGSTGFIVSEKNSQELANLIEWSINHPAEIAEIAQNARKLVQSLFDFSGSVEKILLILIGEINRQKSNVTELS
jgi:colanic acid/amylovoran biosynthesis glycosyltransferase